MIENEIIREKTNCPSCNHPLNRGAKFNKAEVENPIEIGFCMYCEALLIQFPGESLELLTDEMFQVVKEHAPDIYDQLVIIKAHLENGRNKNS